jgi:hypothetical protein
MVGSWFHSSDEVQDAAARDSTAWATDILFNGFIYHTLETAKAHLAEGGIRPASAGGFPVHDLGCRQYNRICRNRWNADERECSAKIHFHPRPNQEFEVRFSRPNQDTSPVTKGQLSFYTGSIYSIQKGDEKRR